MAVIALAALSAVLVVTATRTCSDTGLEAVPSGAAKRSVPANYLSLYRLAGRSSGVAWTVLAAIGSIESDHGRSRAPGVRSGVNRHGCCAGPMQFNLRDGPPSTWQRYRVDGDHDGATDVYDPEDAIRSAANYLHILLRRTGGNLRAAILAYNHSPAYVSDVVARARAYGRGTDVALAGPAGDSLALTDCAAGPDGPLGPANLRDAHRVAAPRAYRALPSWALAGDRPGVVDARLYVDVVWILRRYHLRVTAAREAGHHTHGDGTAVDLVPGNGTAQAAWDASTGALARHLGWTPAPAQARGPPATSRPPSSSSAMTATHGSPRTCTGTCPAHLHLSWASPCYGTSRLSPPCEWVMAFAVLPVGDPTAARPGR